MTGLLLQGRLMSSVLITQLLLLLLLHPSVQFTLVHRPTAQRRQTVGPPSLHDEDAVSSPGRLVTHDNNTPILQAHHHHHQQQPPLLHPPAPHHPLPSSPSTDSTHTLPLLAAHTRRRPANSEKTNREENFRPSHGFGETPAQSLLRRRDEADAEGSSSGVEVKGKRTKTKREELGGLKDSQQHLHQQVVEKEAQPSGTRRQQQQQQQQNHRSDQSQLGSSLHNQRDSAFTEVVQVEVVDSDPDQRAAEKSQLYHTDRGTDKENARDVTNRESPSVVSVRSHQALEGGEKQPLQQQAVAQRTTDQPHVSKMVLTAVGSLTAIVGVCVMAAIFQCCCRRRKRSSSPEGRPPAGGGDGEVVEGEEEEKEGLKQKKSGGSGQGSARTSRSPSPQKGVSKEQENEAEKGQSEKDSLLGEGRKDDQQEEDNDLGDFSMVQRETSILRSYRKPPPPKNRARASRVPRALKAVDPNTSPAMLKELVNNEEKDTTTTTTTSDTPQKTTNGLTSSDIMTPDMQSSMLADIDSTLAAMHDNTPRDPSPPKSAERSRETSVEKPTASTASADDDSSQLKPPAKPSLQASTSREQLAKALAQELTRSASKEMLAKPQSKASTPKSSKETTPKSQSAGASPKTGHGKNLSGASSKDSVGGSNGEGTTSSSSSSGGDSRKGGVVSPEEGDKDKKRPGNIFALIDPTAKGDKGEEAGGRSKIPVRAASSPTQPTAPLRLSAGKDKRFPVPSVHGDQMDQLMKSLKTRLKEDDGDSSKKVSNTTSPQEDSSAQAEEDLDPTGRDRSHSDPTKQAEDKGKKLHQTHL